MKILEMERFRVEPSALWGFELYSPQPDAQYNPYVLPFVGWVLGRASPVLGLELFLESDDRQQSLAVFQPERFDRQALQKILAVAPELKGKLARFRANILWNLRHEGLHKLARKKLVQKLAHPAYKNAGFMYLLDAYGLTGRSTLRLEAVLADARRIPLARLLVERVPVGLPREAGRPRLDPILATGLSRSGGSWFVGLLARHPAIRAYHLLPNETYMAQELLQEALELNRCRERERWKFLDYLEMVRREDKDAFARNLPGLDATVRSRQADPEFLKAALRNAMDEIDAYYMDMRGTDYPEPLRALAEPRFFVEKNYEGEADFPRRSLALLSKIFLETYPDPKEVFLVRDPRDVFCSWLAYSSKLGVAAMGRERGQSDREYLRFHAEKVRRVILDTWRERKDAACLARYEDLILDPANALRKVLEYLGVDSGPGVVDFLVGEGQRRNERTEGHVTTKSPSASIGRWRKDLDADMQRAAREAYGEYLEAFGYPLE